MQSHSISPQNLLSAFLRWCVHLHLVSYARVTNLLKSVKIFDIKYPTDCHFLHHMWPFFSSGAPPEETSMFLDISATDVTRFPPSRIGCTISDMLKHAVYRLVTML